MRKYALLFLGLTLLAIAAACGGGDSSSDSNRNVTVNASATAASSGEANATTQPPDLAADLGFRPETDGYSFENFGNKYPDEPGTLGLDDLRKMFGDAAVCEGDASTTCNAVPGAALFLDAANKSSNGGHCEGFAVTSLRLFKKLDDPTALGGPSAHDLSITGNEALRHYIAFYMASQMVEPVASTAQKFKTETPKQILADISASLKDGGDPLTMGIYKQGGGGHAIVPYAVVDKGEGLFWVLVYDNNWPNQERHIEIDVNKDTWVYNLASTNPGEPAEPWGGDATTFSLDLTPLSARNGPYTCPWCGNDATGRDLIPRALTRVRRLLLVSRIRDWGYRVLLRPGISGVDPRYPKIVELEQRYVVGKRHRDEIPWTMLVGLITHELGHSFLYHHWEWTRARRFIRAFGEVDKAYRGMDNTWVYFQRRRVAIAPRDFVSAYAAKHPQEDFAETFRFYVTRRGRLRDLFREFGQKRKGVILYEKFLVLHDFVRALRGWG